MLAHWSSYTGLHARRGFHRLIYSGSLWLCWKKRREKREGNNRISTKHLMIRHLSSGWSIGEITKHSVTWLKHSGDEEQWSLKLRQVEHEQTAAL